MNTKVYNSLKEFFNRDKYAEGLGDIVSTLGFDKENDGGAANYIVESTAYTNDDQIVFLNDTVSCKGFKLRLLPENGVAYVEQFGAKGNYDLSKVSEADKAVFYENNSNAIQNAFDSGLPSIAFANKVYMVSGDILISKPVRVIGNSAKLKLAQNNDSVITVGCQDAVLENVEISDLILEGVSSSENCTLVSAENVGDFTLNRISFDTANRALSVTSVSENSYKINVRNCTAINVASGFELDNIIDFKINNCRIELADTEDSKGLYFTQKTSFGVVEDVSVYNAECAVFYEGDGDTWDGLAIERILFKNLLIEECNYGIMISYNQIPLHFANAMLVDVNYGIHVECAKNLVVTNSSVLIKSPSTAADDAAPICVNIYAQAKFVHTQFDFPHNFSEINTYDEGETCELSYVDCTMQKTDIDGVAGVDNPKGFGHVTDTHSMAAKIIETFDACEFRSYIKDYKLTTGEGENTVITYNFPITIYAPYASESKLIFKNSRFINDISCDIPYFRIYNGECPDNIVVYNCFFENYNYTDPDKPSDFPLFGKLTNNGLSCDVDDHNIFAKCNMRSSAAVRNKGTTINETVIYE